MFFLSCDLTCEYSRGLNTKDEAEERRSCSLMQLCALTIPERLRKQVPVHVVLMDVMSQARNNLLIEPFHLLVRLRVVLGCGSHLSFQRNAESSKNLGPDLMTLFCQDCVQNPI